jgi:hypothetical protein
MNDLQLQIQRCIEEQNIIVDYLKLGGSNVQGATQGLEDWLMEEVILRLNAAKKLCQ